MGNLRQKYTTEEWDAMVREEPEKTDPIVGTVISKYKERSRVGIEKYGTTLKDNDLPLVEWLNHIQEELMDATLYIQKLKEQL